MIEANVWVPLLGQLAESTSVVLGGVKVIQKVQARMKIWKMTSCSRYFGNFCSAGILMSKHLQAGPKKGNYPRVAVLSARRPADSSFSCGALLRAKAVPKCRIFRNVFFFFMYRARINQTKASAHSSFCSLLTLHQGLLCCLPAVFASETVFAFLLGIFGALAKGCV